MLRNGARVVIVGASLAGLTAAEALRTEGFPGDILLVGAEHHLPYARPPLSKQVLSGTWAADRTILRSPDELHAAGIRTRLGVAAAALDPSTREVVLADGDRLPYDAVVIATGVAARATTDIAGRRVAALRTLDDARLLRAGLEAAESVVVVGAGVLGSEIASVARTAGRATTLVGRARELGLGAVGRLLSSRLVDLHRRAGVRLALGVGVTAMEAGHVTLSDGSRIRGELVVAAIGGEPQTAWLRGSGLDLVDGVLCDVTGCAAPGVYAVGDVARWADPLGGPARRVEHQASAIEQGLSVGRTLATGEPSAPVPPFFWSELHGVRIQAYGSFAPDRPLTPFGEPLEAERELLACVSAGPGRADAIRGIVGWNAPRPFRLARAAVDRAFGAAPIPREVVV